MCIHIDSVNEMANVQNKSTGPGNRRQDSSPGAIRDKKKIEELKQKYNIDKPEDLKQVYGLLNSGQLKFESQLGQQFDDEVYTAYQKLKEGGFKSGTSRKKDAGSFKTSNKTGAAGTKTKKKEVRRLEDYDEEMQAQIKLEMKKADRRRKLWITACSVVAAACIGYFAIYYIRADRSEQRWENLSQLIGSDALAGQPRAQDPFYTVSREEETEIPDVLDKYITLYNSNKNLIGWIKIDDTIIDYPVMQCDDNTYYLEHNFDQEEDRAGALFLDCNCDVVKGNDNYIIYGHHMTSGKMFASLPKYEDESYYEEHPYIIFDTIYEEAVYQVMYAFRSKVYNEDQVVFKYYQFIDAYSEEEFNSYMQEMADMAYYDTGVTAVYGDSLLTLSTCDYQETNGRFVVVAKRIR